MGLPQEVIYRIMDVLQDDTRALKACSLTCKAMFASTRHLIHQTLRVSWANNQKIFTPAEEKRYALGIHRGLELRSLSFMGERDLLKYARRLDIFIGHVFSPDAVEPHLQYFRSLDKIHTLAIHSYYAFVWWDAYSTHFTHFYPTLTTLALYSPIGHYRFFLQFALQFPNLENLALEYLHDETNTWPGITVPPIATESPPLRGHLQLTGLSPTDPVWTREFAFDLPNGINFRSIELRYVHWDHGQHVLNGCADSLEELTIHNIGEMKLLLCSFCAPKTEYIGSHLQIPPNCQAIPISGKTGHSDPSCSIPNPPACPNWRCHPSGRVFRPLHLPLSPNSSSSS